MKNMKNLAVASVAFVAVFAVLGMATTHALPAPTHLLADSKGDACNGLSQLGGVSCGGGQSGINSVMNTVVNIVSYIAGILAIIMIVISGIRFTTSGGDSAKVSSARTALVYALVGVAVAALAQVLVHFVLNTTSAAG